MILEYVLAFVIGGTVTLLITLLENSGYTALSGLAALFPVVTWVSYIFIGQLSGAEAVSKHSLFVLLGTLVAWVPYMFIIHYFSPKIGVNQSIALAIAVFFVLALLFIKFYGLQ